MATAELINTGEDLIDQYRGAEQQIAVALESAMPVLPDGTATQNRNINRQFRRSQQRSMEAFIDSVASQLDEETLDWIRRQLPTTYINGVAKIALGTDSVMPVEWNLMHRQAVTILAADTFADLGNATSHMSDAAKAFIRKMAKAEVLDQVATGRASQIGRRLAKELASEGLTAFVDKSGRHWKLSAYAQMVVRTKRQAAHNTGATMRMHQQGVAACMIIDGTRFDADCTEINGKTCSVPWSLTHPLEHPQCTRTFAPLRVAPDKLDFGSTDDQMPVAQLAKTKPDEQLLYAAPPTINPARNPAQASQVLAKAQSGVQLTDADKAFLDLLSSKPIGLPEPEPIVPEPSDVAYDMGKHALQIGKLDELANVPEGDLASLKTVWPNLPDESKDDVLKGALDALKPPTPPPVPPPPPSPPPVPMWAHEAAEVAGELGYDPDAFLAALTKQQLDAGPGIWTAELTPAAKQHIAQSLASYHKLKVGHVDLPPGFDSFAIKAHDWHGEFTDARIKLGTASYDVDPEAMAVQLEKMRLAHKGQIAKAKIMEATAPDSYATKVASKQRDQMTKDLASAVKEYEGTKKLAGQFGTEAAELASDAAKLAEAAKTTYTPTTGLGKLYDPDAPRPSLKQAEPHVVAHAEDWAKIVDYQERRAIEWYTGSAYHELNERLRKGQKLSSYQQEFADRIDNALAKAPLLDEPTVVWRGVAFSSKGGTWEQRADWAAQEFTVGSQVEWAAYSSTSTSTGVAEGFGGGGVIFEIEARQGVWIRNVSGIASENEFLLPRNTKFEVVNVIRSAAFGINHRTVVQLRQIPS